MPEEEKGIMGGDLSEASDLLLSEVHMETCPPGQQEWRTVYHFKQPDDQERAECRLNSILERIPHARGPNSSRHLVDPDGDIDPPRRHGEGASTAGRNADQIVIHHHLATLLPSVGLQVWRGALLLADLVLALGERLEGVVAVELGAGTGIPGTLLARRAARVFLTDVGEHVLANCQDNAVADAGLGHTSAAVVRQLDWLGPYPWKSSAAAEAEPARQPSTGSVDSMFQWTPHDLEELAHAQLLLAADVVYDDYLTKAFLACSRQLMDHASAHSDNRSPVLLMAAEKRFNFTLNELDARAHAHEHFCKLAQQQDSGLQCMRLDAAMVPQFLEYERGSDLELWLIQCKGPGT